MQALWFFGPWACTVWLQLGAAETSFGHSVPGSTGAVSKPIEDAHICSLSLVSHYRQTFDLKEVVVAEAVEKRLTNEGQSGRVVGANSTLWQTLVARFGNQASTVYTHIMEAHPFQELKKDLTKIKTTFLPGLQPHLEKKPLESALVAASLLWFIFYNFKIYEPDRGENLDRWKHIEKDIINHGCDMMQPDLVLVFHHPGYEQVARAEKVVSKETLGRVLVSWRKNETNHEQPFAMTKSLSKGNSSKLIEAQVALLQDLYLALATMGFDTDVFTSVDDDELIVCVALHDEETIRQQLQLNRTRLQLQHRIVREELGIDQPDEAESSPPYVEYSIHLAKNVLGDGKTDFDLFKVFGQSADKTGKGTILAGQQRIRHVYRYLNARLNLDFAVSQGLLAQWFPAHSAARISDLKRSWGRWALLLDASFIQPMTLLNNYFSPRVAFIFAWNGHYCKFLMALVPIALLFQAIDLIAGSFGPNPYWNRGSVMGFSMILTVWGRWAQNSWAREQHYFATLWDLNEAEKDRSQRADFRGIVQPSHVDRNIEELVYAGTKKTLRMSLSWLLTVSFCCLNFFVSGTWLYLWEGRMNGIAMIIYALIIQSFTQVFNWLAEELTTAENHKFQTDYYHSYLAKMFMVQFVNQYMGFFFITIKQQYTTVGCANHDCVGMIRQTLPTTLLTLVFMQIILVVFATVQVELRLWRERRRLEVSGRQVPNYCYCEKQTKFGIFRIGQQIQMMVQLALTLGHVLIFGSVAPRIVPLCLMVFAIQLRGGAVLLTNAAKRPVPRLAKGIGAWQAIINFLSNVGMLFSAYLFVQFGPVFANKKVLTKVSSMSLYTCFLLMLRSIVDWVVPQHSKEADMIISRRDYVEKKLMEASENASILSVSQRPSVERTAPYSSEVANRDWSRIPKACQADASVQMRTDI